MAATRQSIIKKKEVKASGATSAEASLLGTAFRVPKEDVRLDAKGEDAAVASQRRAIFSRELTIAAAKPYEIPTVEPEIVPEPEAPPEPEPETPSEPTPEEIEADWMARLDKARADAFVQGREEGVAAAKADYETALEERTRQYTRDLDTVQQSWERYLRRAEPQLVELMFRLAGAVIDAPVHEEVRRIGERAVADAVERMATDIPVEIVLHPVSYLRIQESGVEEQLEAIHSRLRWRTDTHLKQNEWIVQSQRAATRRIEAEVMDQLLRELNVRDVTRASSSGVDDDHPAEETD